MSLSAELGARLTTLQTRSTRLGILALAVCLVGAFTAPAQFFRSYLIGYLLWLGVGLGSLAVLLLQHLTGGQWGLVSRRPLEAAVGTLPVLAVLFLPVTLGLSRLYVWVDSSHPGAHEVLEHKALYLNVPFFLVRALIYLATWLLLGYLATRWSREQEQGGSAFGKPFQLVSGLGLLLYGLTATFASVDWVMSLEPNWYSTIYGLQFITGQALSALAFVVPVLLLLSAYEPMSEHLRRSHFHDLGNLILAFVLLWAYLAFSQLLIIWSGNLPEEIPWYLRRSEGGWQWVAVLLAVFHFGVPFAVLLSRNTKRLSHRLSTVAVALLVMRLIDLIWTVEPAFPPETMHIHWMDVVTPIGIGGVWLAVFFRRLKAMPVLPVQDPRFADSLDSEEALEHGAN